MNGEQSRKIEELYLEMYGKLMAYARSALGNEALAEEAVQETFRVACQKPEQLCESVNPRGWLVQALKYIIRNTQSSQAAAQRLIEKCITVQSEKAAFSEDKLELHILYGDLAETEEFKLLSEMVLEGKSHLQMAESRGITVNACKKRVQRAKETLQKKFKN